MESQGRCPGRTRCCVRVLCATNWTMRRGTAAAYTDMSRPCVAWKGRGAGARDAVARHLPDAEIQCSISTRSRRSCRQIRRAEVRMDAVLDESVPTSRPPVPLTARSMPGGNSQRQLSNTGTIKRPNSDLNAVTTRSSRPFSRWRCAPSVSGLDTIHVRGIVGTR